MVMVCEVIPGGPRRSQLQYTQILMSDKPAILTLILFEAGGHRLIMIIGFQMQCSALSDTHTHTHKKKLISTH